MAAIFLDRDGVINRNVFYEDTGSWESPRQPNDFKLHKRVIPALQKLQATGFQLFLVSNQPNVAKRKSSLKELHAVHNKLLYQMHTEKIKFEEYFYCFHHPNGIVAEYSGACQCRKPSPYFLLQAAKRYNLNLSNAWMVGDRDSDIECGRRAGARTIRITSDHPTNRKNDVYAEYTAIDLFDAVEVITHLQTDELMR